VGVGVGVGVGVDADVDLDVVIDGDGDGDVNVNTTKELERNTQPPSKPPASSHCRHPWGHRAGLQCEAFGRRAIRVPSFEWSYTSPSPSPSTLTPASTSTSTPTPTPTPTVANGRRGLVTNQQSFGEHGECPEHACFRTSGCLGRRCRQGSLGSRPRRLVNMQTRRERAPSCPTTDRHPRQGPMPAQNPGHLWGSRTCSPQTRGRCLQRCCFQPRTCRPVTERTPTWRGARRWPRS